MPYIFMIVAVNLAIEKFSTVLVFGCNWITCSSCTDNLWHGPKSTDDLLYASWYTWPTMHFVFPPKCSISAAKLNKHTICCSFGTSVKSMIAVVIKTALAAYDTASKCLFLNDATQAKFVSTGNISDNLLSRLINCRPSNSACWRNVMALVYNFFFRHKHARLFK